MLESRCLLSSDLQGIATLQTGPSVAAIVQVLPVPDGVPTIVMDALTTSGRASTIDPDDHPLIVPSLSSLPGARATLYLDFLGDWESAWGSYNNISTPAFDLDGAPSTFSDDELKTIHEIWAYVSEDYAPFNINVTTVAPASEAHRSTERLVIGGDGAWSGSTCGGLAYVHGFSSDWSSNVAFVFSSNLHTARYIADAASHEAGHGFGLAHQSTYSGTTKTAEYSPGPGDGTAPLMGNSFYSRRSVWWDGQSSDSASSIQDDMAIISGSINGFGYRAHSGGSSLELASPLGVGQDGDVGTSGVILTGSDSDYFTFAAAAGSVRFTVTVPADINNLDPKLEIRDIRGNLLASAEGGADFSATVTVTLPSVGYYVVVVSGGGQYGNAGSYSLGGKVVPLESGTVLETPIDAPSGIRAQSGLPGVISLSWNDVAGEQGFRVERSLDGVGWAVISSTAIGRTTLLDTAVIPGVSYAYRIRTISLLGISSPSVVAIATAAIIPIPLTQLESLPQAPQTAPNRVTNLATSPLAPNRLLLRWTSVANTTGYILERSQNGRRWATIARADASASTWTDGSVAAGRTYFYRIRAFNAWGISAPGNPIRITMPRKLFVSLARRAAMARTTARKL